MTASYSGPHRHSVTYQAPSTARFAAPEFRVLALIKSVVARFTKSQPGHVYPHGALSPKGRRG
jgi:hypothetical protein